MDSIIGGKSDNRVTFSGEPTIDSGDNLPFQTCFVCPLVRIRSAVERGREREKLYHIHELDSSPQQNHHVLPLFRWKKKEVLVNENDNRCVCCREVKKSGEDDYYCRECYRIYHKECVETPSQIKHSYHPKHSLKLFYNGRLNEDRVCVDCGEKASRMVYHCTLCNLFMHPICAKEPVSLVLDQPKRHDHALTFFTRQASLVCNVCGLTNEAHDPTYVCLKCNFVAHKDCAYFPCVIRVSRHNHRVSFALSFPPIRKWSCGVCGGYVDSEYGGYTCNKCDNYAVHSRCALRKQVRDGKELEGVQEEEDDIEENVEPPFETISEGITLHFSHEHALRVQTSKVYDKTKICEACVVPIYEGNFYSCMQCDFILHDTCANAPTRKRHALHPHPLTLQVITRVNHLGYFICDLCMSDYCGFTYIFSEMPIPFRRKVCFKSPYRWIIKAMNIL